MAHVQQIAFCRSVRDRFPSHFSDRLVIDIGSLDINGNNQYLFDRCKYLGVDLAPGRNVDICCKGHEVALPDSSVDTIISTECFEHDICYPQTFQNINRMLKPGGFFLFTCATTGRPEHGTRRSHPGSSPLTLAQADWGDYYKNLDENDVRQVLDIDGVFGSYAFSTNLESQDLYFWGIKHGTYDDRRDRSWQLDQPAAPAPAPAPVPEVALPASQQELSATDDKDRIIKALLKLVEQR